MVQATVKWNFKDYGDADVEQPAMLENNQRKLFCCLYFWYCY